MVLLMQALLLVEMVVLPHILMLGAMEPPQRLTQALLLEHIL